MTLIASLPMYDHPSARNATDQLWRAIAHHARDYGGVLALSDTLERSNTREDHWRSPVLGMSQTCGYPLRQTFYPYLSVLGAPRYAVDGCTGHDYASAFVVRAEDSDKSFADFRGRRLACNGRDSQSGYNVVKAKIGELGERSDAKAPFFAKLEISGNHGKSVAMVKAGTVDLAAIDVVSLALIQRHARENFEGLELIGYSASGPCLPYVTSNQRSATEVMALRHAIAAAMEDPALSEARAALRLSGFDILDADEYARIDAVTDQGRDVVLSPEDL
jgi:ABC-type phosphate/phosphonate transport system substrate-binding protein